MQAKCVIGSQLGDESKGKQVDFLSSNYGEDCCVIRFNGGAQAGHTVVTPDGKRHVFHHIGSGTFNNSATFLSKYFVVNPITFRQEFEELQQLGITPTVFVDENCMVTTPYDMLINQIAEEFRNNDRHGSCGMGVHETINRHNNHMSFYIEDFSSFTNNDWNFLQIKYPMLRFKHHGINHISIENLDLFLSDSLKKRYMEDVEFFRDNTIQETCVGMMNVYYNNFIFEGAQGLLLDENHEWFPHVTRSRTGLTNVIPLAKELGIDELDVHYMTRGYLTRHGAGPLPYEIPKEKFYNVIDETNIPNPWQGTLRYAYLNLDLLYNSITDDLKNVKDEIVVNPKLVVTCLDQMKENGWYHYTEQNGYHFYTRHEKEFLDEIENYTGIDIVYTSYGPTRNDIKRR